MNSPKKTARVTLLCIGPTGEPATGQATATQAWANNSTFNVVVLNNNFEGQRLRSRLWRSLLLPWLAASECWRQKPVALYLSMKRSIAGILTDLACVVAYRCFVTGPVVVHLHGADLRKVGSSKLANAMLRMIWRAVTDVIILSPRMDEQLEGLPQKRVHIVSNFAARMSDQSCISNKESEVANGPLRVLFLSNIMYTKGFTYLADAVNELRREGLDVRLTLAGRALCDGQMTADEALAALEERLGDGVEYLGVLNGKRKWEYLAKAHLIALPTFYPVEAQPISIIEGISFGAIPLTTRHNYNEDFLDVRIALYVEPRSSVAIENVLRFLFYNRTAISGRIPLAWEIAQQRYKKGSFIEKVDCIISDAIEADF